MEYWSHECWAPGFDGESRIDEGVVDSCPECGITQKQTKQEDD